MINFEQTQELDYGQYATNQETSSSILTTVAPTVISVVAIALIVHKHAPYSTEDESLDPQGFARKLAKNYIITFFYDDDTKLNKCVAFVDKYLSQQLSAETKTKEDALKKISSEYAKLSKEQGFNQETHNDAENNYESICQTVIEHHNELDRKADYQSKITDARVAQIHLEKTKKESGKEKQEQVIHLQKLYQEAKSQVDNAQEASISACQSIAEIENYQKVYAKSKETIDKIKATQNQSYHKRIEYAKDIWLKKKLQQFHGAEKKLLFSDHQSLEDLLSKHSTTDLTPLQYAQAIEYIKTPLQYAQAIEYIKS